jgi:hypothetical protein
LVQLERLYRATDRDQAAAAVHVELQSARQALADSPNATAKDKNRIAWELLTGEPANLRNPEQALTYAIAANEMTAFQNPMHLDTLALAYHMNGENEVGLEYAERALALLSDTESDRRADLEATLSQIKSVPTPCASKCGKSGS